MSTKINNGLKFKKKINLDQAYDWCVKIQPKFQKKALQLFKDKVAKIYLELIDHLSINNDKNEYVQLFKKSHIKNPFYFSVDYTKKLIETAEKSDSRFDALDNDLSISIELFKVKNTVLIKYHATNNNLIEILEKDKEIQDYHYNNSGDRPNRLTSKDWNTRRKLWDELSKNNLYKKGYKFQFTTFMDILLADTIQFDEVSWNFRSFESRVISLCNILLEPFNPHIELAKDHTKWMTLLTKTQEWKKTPEYKVMFDKKRQEIEPKLIKKLELKSLIKN